MNSYLQFAILGLGAAAAYAMLAQGVVLIYRASGVINFAHGAYAMAGAYVFYELHDRGGMATVPALLLTLVFGTLLGLVSYWAVLRPLRTAPALTRIIATLGILTILQAAATLRYEQTVVRVESILPHSAVKVLGATVPQDRLWLLGIAVLITIALHLLSHRTRVGLATFAVSESEQAAAALGWSPTLIAAANWGLGAMLACLAGVFVSPFVGLSVNALVLLIVPILSVALLGQFESFRLALLGAVLVGVAQSELISHVDASWVSAAVPFLVIIVVLVVRGRALPLRSELTERPPRLGTGRVVWPVVLALAAAAVAATLVIPDDWVTHLTTTEVFAMLFLSVVILTGFTGQISLAQLTVAGIAALVAGRLVAAQGWAFPLALVVGVVAATVVGALFALPALRTRGVNLAVVTAGLAAAIHAALFTNGDITGGAFGTQVGPQTLFGIDLDPLLRPQNYSLFVLVCLIAVTLVVCNLRRSRSGRRLIAVRLNERAAAALGVNVWADKLYGFALAAIVAGLAGVLLAFSNYTVLYDRFDVMGSITIVTLAVAGGVGYVLGPFLASTLAVGGIGTLIAQAIVGDDANSVLALVGGVFVVLILLMDPNGMASANTEMARKIGRRLRRRPEGAATAPVDTGTVATDGARRKPVSLEIEDLGVRFGGVVALDGVSLRVSPGEIVGLIGPNGAGKTTLVDAVTGFVRPGSGTVKLDGADVLGWPAYRRARAGLVRSFQSLELFDDLTVRENLLAASDPHRRRTYVTDLVAPGRRDLPALVVDTLAEFGLQDDLDRRPEDLPYGRRRLVAIARAVAADPALLLLDEPAAGLDDGESAELRALLRRLVDASGVGLILVEHDVELVMALCDRIVVLDFGKVIASGAPAQVRTDPGVIEAYLGRGAGGQEVGLGTA